MGLSQFTPATSADLSTKYPDLASNRPFEPAWALRALARYDFDLYQYELGAATPCDSWGFTLSSYNGGRGNVIRQKTATKRAGDDPTRWFGHVEDHRVRSVANHRENKMYPRSILLKWQPIYLAWGPGISCEV